MPRVEVISTSDFSVVSVSSLSVPRHCADVAQARHAGDEFAAHLMRHREQDLGFAATAERGLLVGRVIEYDGRAFFADRDGIDVSAAIPDQSTHGHLLSNYAILVAPMRAAAVALNSTSSTAASITRSLRKPL
jgi:hypothetical protein